MTWCWIGEGSWASVGHCHMYKNCLTSLLSALQTKEHVNFQNQNPLIAISGFTEALIETTNTFN